MSLPAPVFYKEKRRIRVGQTAEKQEVTKTFFKHANCGRPDGSYSKCYIGETEDTIAASKIKFWDQRYKDYSAVKRGPAIKDDWLAKFKTLIDSKATKVADPTDSDAEEPKKKKQKTKHHNDDDDDTGEEFVSFMDGNTPQRAYTAKLAKQLVAKHNLKAAPSHALLVEMARYRSILGPLVTPFDLYKWDQFLEVNLPADAPYEEYPVA
ncbi:hypothetical protein NX059_002362 [Plenodomus lindquistii]|nr:hypothetical protein NX059_002362 [Plenodomus lindquistii]